MKSIVVLRAHPGLGDLLCGVPALRALRGAYPDAHIAYVGPEWAAEVLGRFDHYVDELLPFPGWPGLPGEHFEPVLAEAFLDAVHKREFELALELHDGSPAAARFAYELGATRVTGLDPVGELHDVHGMLRAVESLGIPARGDHLELPVDEADRREAADLRPDAPYACIHPGGWPAERFAAIADGLADRGLVPVLTGRSAGDADVAAVVSAARAPVADLAGCLSLGALGVLLAGAWVTVAAKRDVAQLAAAVSAPSVAVAAGPDAHRWAPLDERRHRVVPAPSSAAEVLEGVDALLEPRQLDRRAAIHHHV